jgi:hypothetical protein
MGNRSTDFFAESSGASAAGRLFGALLCRVELPHVCGSAHSLYMRKLLVDNGYATHLFNAACRDNCVCGEVMATSATAHRPLAWGIKNTVKWTQQRFICISQEIAALLKLETEPQQIAATGLFQYPPHPTLFCMPKTPKKQKGKHCLPTPPTTVAATPPNTDNPTAIMSESGDDPLPPSTSAVDIEFDRVLGDKLALIEELRQELVEEGIECPGVVVAGSQSAGKSSVLEHLTRLAFPRAQNTCTRVPTIVALQKSPGR